MNTTAIKNFATKARTAFLKLVSDKLAVFGVTEDECPRGEIKGDAFILNGVPYPVNMEYNYEQLRLAYKELGYEQLVVSVAHTWFNRFCALRYMEVHEYLPFRVFPEAGSVSPDILTHAVDAAEELSMNQATVREMKLAGDKDQELYRLLLLAQCKELAKPLPFLFKSDKQDLYTELLLPDNLLHSDSIIHSLVQDVPEEDWQEIEIIGWLYQYYISEKKDEVIGKVVRKEDIPAATQLFTPNWIVKYMVENSLGRLWLEVNPSSSLAEHMEYYISTAEANPDYVPPVRDHIKGPEDLQVIDPACGSGHILVYAFDLLFKIYEEAGYIQREIPKKILENNLYGIDIDERATQLASFALMMKGRQFDRRLLRVKDGKAAAPHIIEIKESDSLDGFQLTVNSEASPFNNDELFSDPSLLTGTQQEVHPLQSDFTALIKLFEDAKNFGSLLMVPDELKVKLPEMSAEIANLLPKASAQSKHQLEILQELITQAELLSTEYDVCVANPPYMNAKYLNSLTKKYLAKYYKAVKSDLFSSFIIRCLNMTKENGQLGFMSPFVWMFISSYEKLRLHLIDKKYISSLIQLEYSGFEGATVPICTFTLVNTHDHDSEGSFIRLSDFKGAANQAPKALEAIKNTGCGWFYTASGSDFKKIPGAPIAYWASPIDCSSFHSLPRLGELGVTRKGMVTARNEVYVREWHEISQTKSNLSASSRVEAKNSQAKWFPYLKGGKFRKWYGNFEHVVDWENDGYRLRNTKHPTEDRIWATNFNLDFIFSESITWTTTSSSHFGVRFVPRGSIFDAKGSSAFVEDTDRIGLLSFLASSLVKHFLGFLNPTIEFQPGDLANLPINKSIIRTDTAKELAELAIQISKEDWDSYERSWDFKLSPLLISKSVTIKSNYENWIEKNRNAISELQKVEEENNRLYIESYGLSNELSLIVPKEQLTLTINPDYRYGGKLTKEEQRTRFRQDTMTEFISYAIGCMMGRYSLDKPGLIMASAGETLEDYLSRVDTPWEELQFEPDDDGIVPVLEDTYFGDDCYHRLEEFLRVTFTADTLAENLQFLASHFKPKKNETPESTLRRYLSNDFFKDHMKTYKKRPIYWMVSSGKEKAFQALIYMHRYTPSTLSRLRTTYVRELQNKLHSERDNTEQAELEATTPAEKKQLNTRLNKLDKQMEELRRFDEKLRHLADKQIPIDLDDGVKHNYGLFGDLLAEVKAITGKAPAKV